MPKQPDVVSGEIIDSTWGNDIRDRTLQRVASETDRNSSYPSPNPGDLVFVENIGEVQVWNGSTWLTLVDLTGAAFTGPITAASFTTTNGEGIVASNGAITGISTDMRSVSAWMRLLTDGAPYFFRLVQGADGRVTAQTSGNGTDWNDVARFSNDEFRTYETFIANGDVATTLDVGFQQGAAVVGYDPSPPQGGDKYSYQVRNVIVSESIPTAGQGIDGDICMEYRTAGSAQNTPCNVWVKVEGAWRGMS